MTFHFYLAISDNDVRPMTTSFLPIAGDTVHVDGIDHVIDKVTWFSNGQRIEDVPLINVVTDQVVGSTNTLAESIAKQFGDNGQRKIHAIKEYRAATNTSLREAKEAIEDAFVKLGW